MKGILTLLFLFPLYFSLWSQTDPCNILPEDSVILVGDCQEGVPFCIGVTPTQLLDGDYTLLDNGFPFAGQTGACGFANEPLYDAASLPAGEGGTYELVSWSVDGVQYSHNSFAGLNEVADSMNSWNPAAEWYFDNISFAFRGGASGSTFGDMILVDLATDLPYQLSVQFAQIPQGSELFLTEGSHELILIDNNNNCEDSLLVQVACPPFELEEVDTIMAANCETEMYCLPIPYEDIQNNSVSLLLNGAPLSDPPAPCDFKDLTSYYFGGGLASPPYILDGWLINSDTASGSFGDLQDLTDLMNSIDPGTEWTLVDGKQITGYNPHNSYAELIIINQLNDTLIIAPSLISMACGTELELEMGDNELILTDQITSYSDTLTVTVDCELPVIVEATGDTSICVGDSLLLSAIAPGASSFLWSGPNLSCSTCTESIASPDSSTIYTLIATNTNGDSDTAYIQLTVIQIDYTQWYEEICSGDSLEYNGITYTETTADTLYFTNVSGCDSIVFFDLNVLENDSTIIEEIVCKIDSVGIFEEIYQNEAGCDSIVTYVREYFDQADSTVVEILTCDQNEVGSSTEVFSNVEGCDSLVVTEYVYGDTVPPVALCEDITLSLDESGLGILDLDTINAGSYDECGAVGFDLSRVTFNCDDLGIQDVTLFVIDNFGNMSTCLSMVTVVDPIAPVLTCHDTTVNLINNETVQIEEYWIIEELEDNCEAIDITLDKDQFNCTEVGFHLVILTATDVAGNSTTCSANIEVWAQEESPTIVENFTCDSTQTGSVTDTLLNIYGCDSLVTYLTILSEVDTFYNEEITCSQNEVGTFTESVTNNEGCEEVFITEVVYVAPTEPVVIEIATCDSTQVGSVTDTLISYAGCDSLVIYDTYLAPVDTFYNEEITCSQNEVGTFTESVTNNEGCEEVYITEVVYVAPTEPVVIEIATCDSTQVGSVTDTLISYAGCDSLVIYDTYLAPVDTFYNEEITCSQNEVGTFTESVTNNEGCEEVFITEVVYVAPTEPVVIEIVTCDSTQVGSVTDTLISYAGCDSLVIYDTYLAPVDTFYNEEITCSQNEVGTFTESVTNNEGCEEVYITEVVYVAPTEPVVIDIATCDSTQVGSVTDTLISYAGCDSLVIYDTYLAPVDTFYNEEITCSQNEVGTFTESVTNNEGCEEVYITEVVYVAPTEPVVIEIVTCDSTQVGSVTDTLISYAGCDSLVIYDTYLAPVDTFYNEEITCSQNEVGTFTESVTNNEGCEEVYITEVVYVAPTEPVVIDIATCDSTQVGSVTDTLISYAGCDSLVIYDTYLAPVDTFYNEEITCSQNEVGTFTESVTNNEGCEEVYITEVVYVAPTEPVVIDIATCDSTQVGSVTDTLISYAGCDSLVIYDTYLAPVDTFYNEEITCSQNEVGTFTENVTNNEGCEEVYITEVVYVAPTEPVVIDIATCDSTQVGSVTDTLISYAGCDSLVIYDTYLAPVDTFYNEEITCSQNEVGTFTESVTNNEGCEEVYITEVVYVAPTEPVVIEIVTCDNTQVGSVTDTLISYAGCDSLVIYDTYLAPVDTFYNEEITCSQNEVGTFTESVTNNEGCEEVYITEVVYVAPTEPVVIEIVTCDSTQVGSVTDTLISYAGCDSLVIYDTYLAPVDTFYNEEITCSQNEVGTFTESVTNNEGCEEVYITEVVYVAPTEPVVIDIATCDSTQVGSVTDTLISYAGCDSLVIYDTYLAPVDTFYNEEITCSQNEVGTFTESVTNNEGCEEVYITEMVYVAPTEPVVIDIATCDSTQVGSVTDTLTNEFGCDSLITYYTYLVPIDTFYSEKFTCDQNQVGTFSETITNQEGCEEVHLTEVIYIDPSEPVVVDIATCDSTQVGSVTDTLTNEFGCDSLITYYTYLVPIDTFYSEKFTCDQNQVGTFSETITNEEGCEEVHLTEVIYIDPSEPVVVDIATCDSTQVGSVTDTLTNEFGCDSLITYYTYLVPIDTFYSEKFTCDQNQVGTFSETITNEEGCEEVHLTEVIYIDPSEPVVVDIATCDSTQVGSVTDTLTNEFGCDSLITYYTYLVPIDTFYNKKYTCDQNQVGTFSETITNEEGCEEVHLTEVIYIDPSEPVVVDIATCDSTQVGSVKDTLLSIAGCDSLVIYNTYLAEPDSIYYEEYTCDSSAVGTFTEVSTNTEGCEVMVTTKYILTDSPEPTWIEKLSCDSSEAGTITDTLVSFTGCDSLVTTVISYEPIPVTELESTSCNPQDVGDFEEILLSLTGCDSIVIRHVYQDDCSGPVQLNGIPLDLELACGAALPLIPEGIYAESSNCPGDVGIAFRQNTIPNGNCAANYIVERQWTATDSCGNTASKIQRISITDTEAPVIHGTVVDTTIHATFGEDLPIAQVYATDNCDNEVQLLYTETEDLITAGYKLTRHWVAIDACGNESEAKVQVITVIGGPIWPGDTDSTYQVDIFDIFNIGYGWGQSGPARNQPTTGWVAQYSPLWAGYSPINHVNFRHSDTNGDGVINFEDVMPIMENYGQIHDFGNNLPIPVVRNDFQLRLQTAHISADGWATIDILVENDQQIVEDFYGISFNFLFDNSKVVANTMSMSFDDSWAGTIGVDMIKVENESHSEGKFEVALVRTNQIGINGIGKIGSMRFKVKQNTGGEFRMKIEQSIKLSSQGTAATGETGIVDIDMTVTGTREVPQFDHFLKAYPNPADRYLSLNIDKEVQPKLLSLYDLNGKLILEQVVEDHDIQLHIGHIPSGLYFLQIQSEQGIMKKKIAIAH